jgi:alpha-beta hydrolase superfamily lysophospholipase
VIGRIEENAMNQPAPSRRALLTAAAGVAALGATPAQAAETVWRADYTATKQRAGTAIQLAMYRKRLGAPRPGEAVKPVLFLVHGSSPAALASFDLDVPGHGDYSLMDAFARFGFDVWTMDHEGYGRSTRTDGNSDIASGVQDLIAGAAVAARETGQQRMHMLGESSGALRAGAYAMAQPDRINRLVLEAFTYTGAGSPTLGKRAEQVEFYRTHNRRPRDRAMLLSIFTRDKPGTTDPAVAAAFADKEMQNGDSVPTGTYLDMTANLPVVDPARVLCPVLIIKGEYDGISALDDLLAFYRKLPNPDRQVSIIPDAAHAIGMSRNRMAFWHVVNAFLTIPAPPAA